MRWPLPILVLLTTTAACLNLDGMTLYISDTDEDEVLPICINEFMADNDTTLKVGDEYPDWIELFNPSPDDVVLDGWWISDDRDKPDKHAFSDGLVVPAQGALLLYASDSTELGDHHLSFNLAVGGEELVLTAPDGRASIIDFGPLTGDVSAARVTDCCTEEDCWGYLFAGTPGVLNVTPELADLTLLNTGSVWKIYDKGSSAPSQWAEPDYDDSDWWSGRAPVGYGDAHIETNVNPGSGTQKYITNYLRSSFDANNVDSIHQLELRVLRDDGAAVYLNGTEIARTNLPSGELTYDTLASGTASEADETTYHLFVLKSAVFQEALVQGSNTLAIEVHQASPASSDLGLDAGLVAQTIVPPESLQPLQGDYKLFIEEVAGLEDPSAWLFDDTLIHQIDIDVPSSSLTALQAYPYGYQPASVSLDGQYVESIGIRLRGKYGSYRELSGKPKLKIDFNRFVTGQRFFGLESLSLNNSVVDCSYLKEAVGYQVFAAADLPTPRLAFVNVTLNGADYGLYQLIDSPDEIWLERHYSDASGNLYDGKYTVEWPWTWIGFTDFWSSMDDRFQLEEGVDVDLQDIRNITHVNETFGQRPAFYSEMDAYLDWERFHRHLAVEQWTGHVDGYWTNTNNYRIYFDPEDGLADIITWDLDYAFLHDFRFNEDRDWDKPASAITWNCRANSACWSAQADAAEWLVHRTNTSELEQYFFEKRDLIADRARTDPRRECQSWDIANAQDDLLEWIGDRDDEIADYWNFENPG